MFRRAVNHRGVIKDPAKRTFMGRVYHSASEMKFAMELEAKRKAHLNLGWVPQYTIPLTVNGKHICDYIVDFKVFEPDYVVYYEIKGHETDIYKLKRRLMAACHPDLDYRVLYVTSRGLIPEAQFIAEKKANSKAKAALKRAAKKAKVGKI